MILRGESGGIEGGNESESVEFPDRADALIGSIMLALGSRSSGAITARELAGITFERVNGEPRLRSGRVSQRTTSKLLRSFRQGIRFLSFRHNLQPGMRQSI